MRRTNINAVLRMVKKFLSGEISATTFYLDFPYEVTKRYDGMQREDPDYADMIMFYLVECGTDRYEELPAEEYRKLIQQQYDNVMEGVY